MLGVDGGSNTGLRTWVMSEDDHNSLRADGSWSPGRLLDLARGRA